MTKAKWLGFGIAGVATAAFAVTLSLQGALNALVMAPSSTTYSTQQALNILVQGHADSTYKYSQQAAANRLVNYGAQFAIPPARTNTAVVPVTGFSDSIFTTANVGINSQRRTTLFQWNHRLRLRQSGEIKQAKFYVGTTTGLNGFYFEIWRRRTGDRFDLVATSVNLLSRLTADATNTLTLASSDWTYRVAGAYPKEGDYYAIAMTAAATGINVNTLAMFTNYPNTRSRVKYVFNGTNENQVSPAVGFQWFSQSSITARCVPVIFYMTPPQVVWIGYSHIAGHNMLYSFVEDVLLEGLNCSTVSDTCNSDITTSLPAQFAALRPGITWQNTGIGGQTSSQIRLRASQHCYRLKPRIAIIQLYGNDQPSSVWNTVGQRNLRFMCDSLTVNGIQGVFVLPIQQSGMSDAWATQIDSLISPMQNIIRDKMPNAIIVDPRYEMSRFRAGDVSGNRWGCVAAYSVGDSLHFNATGQMAFAVLINNALKYDFTRP